MSPKPPDQQSETAAKGAPRRSRVPRVLGGIALFLVLLIGGALLYMQTDSGRARIQSFALGKVQGLLADGVEVSVAGIDGSLLTGVRIFDLTVSRLGETILEVDTVKADYNLFALLKKTFSARDVAVSGLRLVATQDSISHWNLAQLLKPSEEDDKRKSTWTIQLDDVQLRVADAEVHFWADGRDSVLFVDQTSLAMTGFSSGPGGLRGSLDTLYSTVRAPSGTGALTLNAVVGLADDEVTVQLLTLHSPGTNFRATGRVGYGTESRGVNVDVDAAQLSFDDVRAFFPIPLYGRATIDLQAEGTLDNVQGSMAVAFDDGGSIEATGSFSSPQDGPVHYDADATISNLNLAGLLDDTAFTSDLNGELNADLRGTHLEQLNGIASMHLLGSYYGEQAIDQVDLEGQFDAGLLRFSLNAAVPGAVARAEGRARPFADVPEYDVQGVVDDINLAVLLGNPNQPGRFSGEFALAGHGFDPERAEAEANVRLTRATFNEWSLDSGVVEATLSDGAVRYRAGADLNGEGNYLAADGVVQPFGDELIYSVEHGLFTKVDIAAFTGNTTHTDLSGTFTLDGIGFPPDGSLDAEVALRNSRYADTPIPAADVTATLEASALSFTASVDLAEAGKLEARGTAQPFETPLSYHANVSIEHLNLGTILRNESQDSDLTGTFGVDGTGIDPEALQANLQLNLSASRFRDQEITSGEVDGSVQNGHLDALVNAVMPEGEINFSVTGRPFDDVAELALSGGDFRGVNLASLLGNPALQTNLSGTLTASVNGIDLQTAAITSQVTFLPSTINEAPLEKGMVHFTLVNGDLDADATLKISGGTASFTAGGRPMDPNRPTYQVHGGLQNVDLMALFNNTEIGPTSVSLAFDIEGNSFDPELAHVDARVHGHGHVGAIAVDTLDAQLELDASILHLYELSARSNVADVQASGVVDLHEPDKATSRTDVSFDAVVKDPAPIADLLDVSRFRLEAGEVHGRAQADPGDPIAVSIQGTADEFAFQEYGARHLNSEILGTYVIGSQGGGPLAGFDGEGHIQFDEFSYGSRVFRNGDVDVQATSDSLRLAGTVSFDDNRSVDFSLRTDPALSSHKIDLDGLSLRLFEDNWRLLQPATITYADSISFHDLRLRSENGHLDVNGSFGSGGRQDLNLSLAGLHIESFADLSGFAGISGTVNADVVLGGTADLPDLDGTLSIDGLKVNGQDVGTGEVQLGYDDQRLTLDARLARDDAHSITANGFVPLNFAHDSLHTVSEDSAIQLTVRSESFPVDWVTMFLPQSIDSLGGALSGEINVSGTWAQPQLHGEAQLQNGAIGVPATGRVFNDILLPMRFDNNRIVVEGAHAGTENNGALRLNGEIQLSSLSLGELDLSIIMDDFRVMDTETYRNLRLTANESDSLRFAGTTQAPRLTGAVALSSGDIYMTEELTGPKAGLADLDEAEIHRLEETFGISLSAADTTQSRFFQNLDLNVTAEIDQNVWFRSRHTPRIDIEFSGVVEARKQLGGEIELFQSVDFTRGHVELFSSSFQIKNGTLSFNGPFLETYIDLEATALGHSRIESGNEPTVTLVFTGRLADNPEVELHSDPTMEEGDILCYVATGQLCNNAISGKSASNLAVAELGALVEGVAAQSLGLDVVDIESRADGSIVATFGVYLTNKFYASLSQIVVPPRDDESLTEFRIPEVLLEYQLRRWLLVDAERRAREGLGAAVVVTKKY